MTDQTEESSSAIPKYATIPICLETDGFDAELKLSLDDSVTVLKSHVQSLFGADFPHTSFNFVPANDSEEAFKNPTLGSTLAENGVKKDSKIGIEFKRYTKKECFDHINLVRRICGFREPYCLPVVDAGRTTFPLVANEIAKTEKNAKNEQVRRGPHPLIRFEKNFAAACEASSRPKNDSKYEFPEPALLHLELSGWNPVPPHMRVAGHLCYLYLDYIGPEGLEMFHITASEKGFWISNSTDKSFDPSHRLIEGLDTKSESLLSLIMNLSPTMASYIRCLADDVEEGGRNFFNPSKSFLSAPWLVLPSQTWPSDVSRCQIGLAPEAEHHNWNEELQSLKDLLAASDQEPHERLLSEAYMVRLHFKFTQAAVQGAMDIIAGSISPLNPDDPPDGHIFLQDGIFYSFGLDGSKIFEGYGEDEAARYAASKDLAGINALGDDFQDIHTLRTVIVDYCGQRVICQALLPGILTASDSSGHILYGSIDNGEKVVADEEYDEIMEQIGEHFHLKRHKVWGKDQDYSHIASSAEMKGMNGDDNRKYVVDLYRAAPLDLMFLDRYCAKKDEVRIEDAYPHSIAVLRVETVDLWFQHQIDQEVVDADGLKADLDEVPEDKVKELNEKLRLNPDIGPDQYVHKLDRDEFRKDQEQVRDVCRFLRDVLIPDFVDSIENGKNLTPIDGQSLTRFMHERGIPMRYLGEVHEYAAQKGPELNGLRLLVEQEALARAMKHMLNKRMTKSGFLRENVVNFFNEMFPIASDRVADEVYRRFRFSLTEEYLMNGNEKSLFREISLKTGLQWKSKDYKLDKSLPFDLDDLVNIAPVIKTIQFKSKLASHMLACGEQSINSRDEETLKDILTGKQDPKAVDKLGNSIVNEEGEDVGLRLTTHSLALFEQIYGTFHMENARALVRAAVIHDKIGDYETACQLCRKSIIIAERIQGLDSSEAINAQLKLSIFELNNGNPIGGLEILKNILSYNYLFQGGLESAQIIMIMANAGTMLQAAGKFEKAAAKWFRKAVKTVLTVYDEASVAAGSAYYQLAQALIRSKKYHEASNFMLKSYHIFQDNYGDEDEMTKDCKKWFESLVPAAVSWKKRGLKQVVTTTGNGHETSVQKKAGDEKHVNGEGNVDNEGDVDEKLGSMGDKSVDELMEYIGEMSVQKNDENGKNKENQSLKEKNEERERKKKERKRLHIKNMQMKLQKEKMKEKKKMEQKKKKEEKEKQEEEEKRKYRMILFDSAFSL